LPDKVGANPLWLPDKVGANPLWLPDKVGAIFYGCPTRYFSLTNLLKRRDVMKQVLLNVTILMSLTIAPLSVWANCQQADNLFKQAQQQRDHSQKIGLLKQATLLCSNHKAAHYELAELQKEENNWAEAEGLYKQVIKLDPNNAQAYAGLGDVLMKRERYDEAAEMFDKSLTLAQTNPAHQSQIGKYQARLEKAQDQMMASLSSDQIWKIFTSERSVGPAGPHQRARIPLRFESNSHHLKDDPSTRQQCQKMATAIKKLLFDTEGFKNSKIRIEGHTDSKGSAHYNEILSERRARSVKEMLINEFRVPADRLYTIGMGEYHPIASNETPHGRFLNRRVNLVTIKR
jgi:outer membrane protein OmpA-like peptidoglycan-associated protein